MSFHNVQLPTDISYGATGGPAWGTTVQTTASGHEYRISRASRPRRRYEFDKLLMEPATWGALVEFWMARRGHLHAERKDRHSRHFKQAKQYSELWRTLRRTAGSAGSTP